MRSTPARAPFALILAVSATLLACGHGGGAGQQRATAAAREVPSETGARSGAPERRASEDPFGSRSDERKRQDSVLRASGHRHRQKPASDSL